MIHRKNNITSPIVNMITTKPTTLSSVAIMHFDSKSYVGSVALVSLV